MGRYSRKEKQKLVAEINITPFTDVILVLLIIFMITTPLISQANIKVNLPEANNTKPTENVSRFEVTVTDSGQIYFGKDPVSEKELKEKIGALRKNNPDINVFLRADRSVKFKFIVKILDILTELGVKNLNISAVATASES